MTTPSPEGLQEAALTALRLSQDLIACIKQRSSDNLWWVDATDPETAVCDTYTAVEKALSTPPRASRSGATGCAGANTQSPDKGMVDCYGQVDCRPRPFHSPPASSDRRTGITDVRCEAAARDDDPGRMHVRHAQARHEGRVSPAPLRGTLHPHSPATRSRNEAEGGANIQHHQRQRAHSCINR
jgi:hypothetical protein